MPNFAHRENQSAKAEVMNAVTNRLLFVAVLAGALAFASPAAAQTKLGHLNFQELLSSMPEAQQVEAQMNEYGKALQSEYNRYVTEFSTMQSDYQTQGANWSEVKREAVEKDLERLLTTIQEFESTTQEKILNKQNLLMTPLIEQAQQAVEEVGADLGLTYVLDSSTLLHIGADARDIMPQVKAKLNL